MATQLTTPEPASAARNRSFDGLLSDYRRCQAEQNDFYRQHVVPAIEANDRHVKLTAAWRETLAALGEQEEVFGEYVMRTHDAMEALLTAPAPDHDALATKLRIALEEELFTTGYDAGEFAAAMLADVLRLDGGSHE